MEEKWCLSQACELVTNCETQLKRPSNSSETSSLVKGLASTLGEGLKYHWWIIGWRGNLEASENENKILVGMRSSNVTIKLGKIPRSIVQACLILFPPMLYSSFKASASDKARHMCNCVACMHANCPYCPSPFLPFQVGKHGQQLGQLDWKVVNYKSGFSSEYFSFMGVGQFAASEWYWWRTRGFKGNIACCRKKYRTNPVDAKNRMLDHIFKAARVRG